MDIETDYDHVTQHKLTQLAGCARRTWRKIANTKHYKNALTWWNKSPVMTATNCSSVFSWSNCRKDTKKTLTNKNFTLIKIISCDRFDTQIISFLNWIQWIQVNISADWPPSPPSSSCNESWSTKTMMPIYTIQFIKWCVSQANL